MKRKSGRFNRALRGVDAPSIDSNGSHQAEHRLESLEQRLLLSASASDISSNWFGNINPAATVVETKPTRKKAPVPTLEFQNRQWEAAPNQLIVQLTSSAAKAARSISNVANYLSLDDMGATVLKGLGLEGMFLIETAPGNIDQVAESLQDSGKVEFVTPNGVIKKTATTNDPLLRKQLHHENSGGRRAKPGADIGTTDAWEIQTGSFDVVGAVIDDGVDFLHEDLFQNMWINPGEVAGNGIDDDNNGFIDDIYGWDFADNDATPFFNDPDFTHGTQVAGVMAAAGNNGTGISGVVQQGQIMALKIFEDSGLDIGFDDAAIEAINYATMMREMYGINIVVSNNSWGTGANPAIDAAIQAHADAGILFVGASGNDALNNDLIPDTPSGADVDNVIAVASTNFKDKLSAFSNYGTMTVDLAAPGQQILTTTSNNRYTKATGTSFAAPMVAGAAMLLASEDPGADYLDIKRAILAGVDLVEPLQHSLATGGRLNVYNSLMFIRGEQGVDGYESNDGAVQAASSTVAKQNKKKRNRRGPARILSVAGGADLATMNGQRTLFGLNMIGGDGEDWFRFEQQDFGTDENFIRIDEFTNADGNIDIELFAADGVTLLDGAYGSADIHEISLEGTDPGVYFIRVFQVGNREVSHYNLTVNPGLNVADAYEAGNNGIAVLDLPAGDPFSSNLGIAMGRRKIANLNTLDGSSDAYRFELINPATSNKQKIEISFKSNLGNLDLYLFTEEGFVNGDPPIAFSATAKQNKETIFLRNAPAGAYVALVDNPGGSLNPNYRLDIIGGRTPADGAGNNAAKARKIPRITTPFTHDDFVGSPADTADYYKFSVGNIGASVLITLSGLTDDADLELLDRRGNVLAGSFNPGTMDEVITALGPIDLDRGEYYIRVTAARGAQAFYTIETIGTAIEPGGPPNRIPPGGVI